jgi:hypothetical protein
LVRIPTLIKFTLVPVNPIRRHVMRGMSGAGGKVDEERLVRCERLLGTRPGNRLVGHISGEVVIRVVGQMDGCRAIVANRRKLMGLTADKTIELVET